MLLVATWTRVHYAWFESWLCLLLIPSITWYLPRPYPVTGINRGIIPDYCFDFLRKNQLAIVKVWAQFLLHNIINTKIWSNKILNYYFFLLCMKSWKFSALIVESHEWALQEKIIISFFNMCFCILYIKILLYRTCYSTLKWTGLLPVDHTTITWNILRQLIHEY